MKPEESLEAVRSERDELRKQLAHVEFVCTHIYKAAIDDTMHETLICYRDGYNYMRRKFLAELGFDGNKAKKLGIEL